jgi:hypothetical protein
MQFCVNFNTGVNKCTSGDNYQSWLIIITFIYDMFIIFNLLCLIGVKFLTHGDTEDVVHLDINTV